MKLRKRIKNGIIYWFLVSVIRVSCLLPRFLVLGLLGGLGRIAYTIIPDARRKTIRNLKMAFGQELTDTQVRDLARQVFINSGKNLADIFRLRTIRTLADLERIVSVTGLEYLEGAFRKGRGVICITGHIGAFELLAAYVGMKGYPTLVIGTQLYDKRLDDLLIKNRQHTGVENITRGKDTIKVVKSLKRGAVLGILIDQDTKVESCFVDFFGKPAATPVGAAVLAQKTGATVIPISIKRLADDTHCITVQPELPLVQTGDEDKDKVTNTQQWTWILEGIIRAEPAQWVWMHERWKRQPKNEKRLTIND